MGTVDGIRGSDSDPLSGNLWGIGSVWGRRLPLCCTHQFCVRWRKTILPLCQRRHKLDAIQRSSKASFCVIDQDQIVSEKYTTYFRSVIAFGQIRFIEDEKEKRAAIEKLTKKYSPDEDAAGRRKEIDREWKTLCMLEMCIDHMTGKEAIELVKNRQEK